MSDDSRPDRLAAAVPQALDPRRWKALILLCVTSFMVTLDSQIVILALPSIEKDLRFVAGAEQWVMSSYLLVFGGLLLFGGRLSDLRGRRRMFLIGTVLFLVSSVLCGLAWSGGVLIGARVLQGISAAIMAPAALAILMTMFPEGAERNRALAFWSGVGGLGATAALLIGGAVAGSLGWEWIFYLNVPVAIGLLVFGPVLLLESRDSGRTRSYDPAGAITVTLGLMLLITAIVQVPTQGWTSGAVLGLLLGAAVLLGLFVVVENRSAVPLVPMRMFRSRMFVAGNLAMALIGMAAWGMNFTASGYAQDVLDYSPLQFGLATTAMTLMAVVGAYGAQAGVTRVGSRVVAAIAVTLLGAGAILLSRIPVDGNYVSDLLPGFLFLGLGLGGGTVAAASAALSAVDESVAGVASGTNTAAFQIGGALGTAIVSSVTISQAGTSSLPDVLTEGFQAAFTACVAFALIGLGIALALFRRPTWTDKTGAARSGADPTHS